MGLEHVQRLAGEVIHHYEAASGDIVQSLGRRFDLTIDGQHHTVSLPTAPVYALLGSLRIARRALRLDKSNAVINFGRTGAVIVYRGTIYFYDFASRQLTATAELHSSRQALHRGVAVTRDGIYLGEYGGNPGRRSVPLWRSTDDGRTWQVVYEFPVGSIKHIHGVYADPYTDRLWIPTGDFAGECFLVEADSEFRDVTWHGDGSQRWRAVSLLFHDDRIVWGMDSQLERSHLQVFDRETHDLVQGQSFPGPVWYTKQLSDGVSLLQTTVEIGPGVESDTCDVFASHDDWTWFRVASFRKDRLPMRYFKFGVIGFADGEQTSDDFVLFGEALRGLEGKAVRARLTA